MAERKGVWSSSPDKEGDDEEENIDQLIYKSQQREKELQKVYEMANNTDNAIKSNEAAAK